MTRSTAVSSRLGGTIRAVALAALLPTTGALFAQTLVSPPPNSSVDTPLPSNGSSTTGTAAAPQDDTSSPLKYGPLTFRPHVEDTFLHGTGILSAPGAPQTTGWHSVAAGLTVELGPAWHVDYTPRWNIYTNHRFHDVVNHDVHAQGSVLAGGWIAAGATDYSRTTSPLIETGRQTTQQTSVSTVALSHDLSEHFGIVFSGQQDLRFVEKFPDMFTWTGSTALFYRISEGLDISPTMGVGYDASIKRPASLILRPQVRVHWKPDKKLDAEFGVGREERRPLKHKYARAQSPTFLAALQYRPFESTALQLGAAKTLVPSLLAGQNRRSTSWSAGWEQRVFGHVYVSAERRAQTADYVYQSAPGALAARRDHTFAWSYRVRMKFLKRAQVALLLRTTKNESDVSGFAFSSRQVGFELGYAY